MSKAKENWKKNLEKLEDDESLYDEFEGESDRGHALLAASALDLQLRNLITHFLIDTEEVNGLMEKHLRSFDTRIEISYFLGLITDKQHANLSKIHEIRNHFAHNLHGSIFDDEPVRRLCLSLEVEDADPEYDNIPRNRYTSAYTELALDFQYWTKSIQEKCCKVREKTWYEFARDELKANPQKQNPV